jgi:formate hydrogenlyase subunit 6/NADH:ubiquinone oxidoreductase subunit I
MQIIDLKGFDALLEALRSRGYELIGPQIRENALVYDRFEKRESLAAGWTDVHGKGHYRLEATDSPAVFGCVVGPHSWKQFLYPPRTLLWQAERTGEGFTVLDEHEPEPKLAFIGARPCEAHAIAIQDQVFMRGAYVDSHYAARRKRTFVVVANCTRPGGTCFCASMGTGPGARDHFDLALTEVLEGERHFFTVETGSAEGQEVLDAVPREAASDAEAEAARASVDQAAASMGRELDMDGVPELLQASTDSSRWDMVAERCLACANCTMACPTCFCSTVEDVTALTGEHAERWRTWDSCFTSDFSYIHGGSVRKSTQARYRHWITHKLSTWYDQFGTAGCVGCGRCITWCPVGIDITEEVAALREGSKSHPKPVAT